jgi:hypothetical protein
MTSAIDLVRHELKSRIGKLLPIPLEQVRSTFQDLSRSAGHCFFAKYKCKRDIPDSELDHAEEVLANGHPRDLPPYAIAFRSQIRRYTPKHRVILVSPGPVAMVEKRFAYPLQVAMEKAPYPKPWATGWDWFCSGGSQVSPFIDADDTASLDFENFDWSTPPWLNREVFLMIKDLFHLTEREAHIFTGIIRSHCDSEAKFGTQKFHLSGGVRTGSSFTHVFGTILCMVIIRYLVGDCESISFGDDVLLKMGSLSISKLTQVAQELSSFRISKTKSKRGVHWLGFQWSTSKRRWLLEDPDKRWAQFFWPERPSDPVARLQAMFLNCLSDPIRHVIAKALIELHSESVLSETVDLIGGRRLNFTLEQGVSIFDVEERMKRFHRLERLSNGVRETCVRGRSRSW